MLIISAAGEYTSDICILHYLFIFLFIVYQFFFSNLSFYLWSNLTFAKLVLIKITLLLLLLLLLISLYSVLYFSFAETIVIQVSVLNLHKKKKSFINTFEKMNKNALFLKRKRSYVQLFRNQG